MVFDDGKGPVRCRLPCHRPCVVAAVTLGLPSMRLPRTFNWECRSPAKLAGPATFRIISDIDPSPSAKDYKCGTLTYDKHNGTDFRLPSLEAQKAGVEVLASASGRVLRTRDGAPDGAFRKSAREAVRDVECGNGLVIEHARTLGNPILPSGQWQPAGKARRSCQSWAAAWPRRPLGAYRVSSSPFHGPASEQL